MTLGRVMCVVGVHRWQHTRTPDGESYRRCRRCGRDDAGLPAVRGTAGADNQAWPR